MANFNRITINPKRMNGQPCIRDLRLTVRRVLEILALYPDRRELYQEYPELEDEDILQALAYAAATLYYTEKSLKPKVFDGLSFPHDFSGNLV